MAQARSPEIRDCAGFTYVGLLIAVAIMGVTLAAIGTFWHINQQRAREQQLLFIGNQFSRAINAYYQNSPDGVKQFPKRLEDLLLDKRQPNVMRYLRKMFFDPITGSSEWGLIKGAGGGIVGVYSLSEAAPIKTDNFGRGNESFALKQHYSEWKFNSLNISNTMLADAAAPGKPAVSFSPGNNLIPGAHGTPATGNDQGNVFSGAAGSPGSPVTPDPSSTAPAPAPPDPLPPDPADEQNRLRLCQIMRGADARTCVTVGAKYGSAAGAACMASASNRYAVCISDDHAPLPALIVQYK